MTNLTFEMAQLLDEPIQILEQYFGQRVLNALENRGILHIEQLLNTTPEELLAIPNFGQNSLEKVYRGLAAHGFVKTDKHKTP
jgi:DNA-directed RNA polymerase alpha subunit